MGLEMKLEMVEAAPVEDEKTREDLLAMELARRFDECESTFMSHEELKRYFGLKAELDEIVTLSILEYDRERAEYTNAINKVGRRLLGQYNLLILNIPGVGYEISTADDQVSVEFDKRVWRARNMIRRASRIAQNVRVENLSDEMLKVRQSNLQYASFMESKFRDSGYVRAYKAPDFDVADEMDDAESAMEAEAEPAKEAPEEMPPKTEPKYRRQPELQPFLNRIQQGHRPNYVYA
jgi:hypothetical protein